MSSYLILFVLYPSAPPPPLLYATLACNFFFCIDLVMVERALEVYVIYLWLMYFYQISYIDDCDDVDELMGAEWVCHKEV